MKKLLLLSLLLASACNSPKRIAIGSKNFTEQLVLSEIAAQVLEHGLKERVERKLNLGGTLVAHQALRNGQIDLYPEYTGTALTAVLKEAPPADPEAALRRVQQLYRERFYLAWMEPLGFNDTFAMVIRGDAARSLHLQTLTEAAAVPQAWKLGVGYEFEQRADGLAALRRVYGLRLDGGPKAMDLGLLYEALHQNRVSMAAGNSTDGILSARDFRELADDRHAFPPYQACFVVRTDLLAGKPQVRVLLESLQGKIKAADMRRMNYEVDGKRRPVRLVAQEFLARQGSAAAKP